MQHRFVFALLSFLSLHMAWGQSVLSLTGSVADANSNQPIAFASVSILGKSVGTVTNARGDFDFYIPEEYSSDTLVISHVGYKSFKQRISDFNSEIIITLVPSPILLDEVEICEKNLTGKEIIVKAVKNFPLNYTTKPFCLEGFFREIEEENGRYVLLSEAALDVYDRNFDGRKKNDLQESIVIREMRQSLRYSEKKNRDNIGHAFNDLFENNDVRYNRGMLDTANQFSIDTLLVYNERTVYGITMINKTDSGMLFIDAEDYGIRKITMERKSRDHKTRYYYNRPGSNGTIDGRVWFRFSVEFEPYSDKLYLRRIHESELTEIYDRKTGEVKIAAVETLEFITTNIRVNLESATAQRLRYGSKFKTLPYHPEFWKQYNILKLTPLNEKLIHDLEKDVTLQKQYEIPK